MTDKSLVEQIKHYQRDIVKCPDNSERMLRCIERLHVLPVTIAHLQETGVGRSVNELRKCGGQVGAAAGALVCKWKSMVRDEEEDDSAVDSESEEYKEKVSDDIPIANDKQSNREHNRHTSKSTYRSSAKENEHINRSSTKEIGHRHDIKLSSSSKHKPLGKSDEKVNSEKASVISDSSVIVQNSSQRHKSDQDSSKDKKNHSSHSRESKHNGIHQSDKIISAYKSSSSSTSTKKSESKSKDGNPDKSYDKRKHSQTIKEDLEKKHLSSSHKLTSEELFRPDKQQKSSNSITKSGSKSDESGERTGKERKSSSSESIKNSNSGCLDKNKHKKTKYHDSQSKDNTLSKLQSKNQGDTSYRDYDKNRDKKDYKRSHDKSRDSKDNRNDKEVSDKLNTKQNISQKYKIERSDSESSDEDVYKPRRKRKRSTSTELEEAKKNVAGKTYKPHKKQSYSSEESNPESVHDYDSDRSDNRDKLESQNGSDSNQDASSDDEEDQHTESDVQTNRSIGESTGYEDSNDSRMDSRNSDDDNSSNSEIYVKREIKKEKESPPRNLKTENPKSTKVKNTHHENSSKSYNSKKDVERKNLKIKKEKHEINAEHKENTHYRNENKSRPKDLKSSSSTRGKESKHSDKKAKVKLERAEDGSIDCESGASFADALLGLGSSSKKTFKKKVETPPQDRSPKPNSSSVKDRSSSKFNSSRSSSSPSTTKSPYNKEVDLLSRNVKLEPLDVDLSVTLPEITPNYKPQPHYSPPDSLAKRLKMSDENALASIMSNKNQRTKVYSGNKSGYQEVPSLFDQCIQILRENIDGLEYTGGVPYDLLKPVLDRATASQLYNLEDYNPYLMEDTDGLWKFHCSKDFRGKKPDEFETWRELYWRLFDEREKKLQELSANLRHTSAQSIANQRKTKLAYVDSFVKPPRNVARNQMKFGTGKAVKHELVSKPSVGPSSVSPAVEAPVRVPPPRPHLASQAFPIPNFLKKKKAPLMAKTLQLMKGHRFKR